MPSFRRSVIKFIMSSFSTPSGTPYSLMLLQRSLFSMSSHLAVRIASLSNKYPSALSCRMLLSSVPLTLSSASVNLLFSPSIQFFTSSIDDSTRCKELFSSRNESVFSCRSFLSSISITVSPLASPVAFNGVALANVNCLEPVVTSTFLLAFMSFFLDF
ncbi:hypothetical protein GOODEAATRI_033707 [Goodea atripinnis]|uniref:Uncharacterized protein n=1 Tax=Goodea atripinnis TaxID=208336 RepID=A0ABV0MXA3_9TELE